MVGMADRRILWNLLCHLLHVANLLVISSVLKTASVFVAAWSTSLEMRKDCSKNGTYKLLRMKRGIEYALASLYYPISSYYRLNSLYGLENRSYTPVFFPLNKSPYKLHSDMRWHFYNASTSPLLQLEA